MKNQKDLLCQSANNLYMDKKQTHLDEYEIPPIPFFSLFRFAEGNDYILMVIGIIAALCNGGLNPLFILLCGNMIDSYKIGSDLGNVSLNLFLYFIYIGVGIFASGWIMITCWRITGQRQSIKCRNQYLKSLLRQEIGWYDCIKQDQISSQFSMDSQSFQSAIVQKIGLNMYVLSTLVSGFIVSFTKGWLLTLALLGIFPIVIGSMYLFMLHIFNKGKREQKNYVIAGGYAEQALSSIKTVKMFNGETYQSKKYDQCLQDSTKGKIRYGAFVGLGMGSPMFSIFLSCSLAFWFGAHCIEDTDRCPRVISQQQYTAGIVFIVAFNIIFAGFTFSQLPPSLKKITQGRSAAARIYKIIDRQPSIKNPQNGIKIQNLKGIIKFTNVNFSYPKDKSKRILNNLNLQINKEKVAFVGESGCGKSTILQLIMRLYDPDEGIITIDGYDLKTINLNWWRQVIGYVGQQPVLFAASIKQNLLIGKKNTTDSELEEALRKAEAWDFVNNLQNKMNTYVGIGGGQVSGGQKQRIAIARAILRDPKILLLDQATSALDRKNQKLIQNTLNKITRTSITIAHKVKTIMASDEIFVIQQGKIKQHGNFKQLETFKGLKIEQQQKQNQIKMRNNNKQISIVEQQKQIIEERKVKTQQIIEKQNEKEQLLQIYNKSIYRRVFSYAKGNQVLFIIGIFFSCIAGSVCYSLQLYVL